MSQIIFFYNITNITLEFMEQIKNVIIKKYFKTMLMGIPCLYIFILFNYVLKLLILIFFQLGAHCKQQNISARPKSLAYEVLRNVLVRKIPVPYTMPGYKVEIVGERTSLGQGREWTCQMRLLNLLSKNCVKGIHKCPNRFQFQILTLETCNIHNQFSFLIFISILFLIICSSDQWMLLRERWVDL